MELLHQEITGKIIKAAYKVFNTIGFGFQEKEYQTGLAAELEALGLHFAREVYSDLKYLNKKIRGFFIDFVVEGKIAIELKVARQIYQKHYFQMNQYLRNNKLELGLIIVFSPTGVIVKRVVNLE